MIHYDYRKRLTYLPGGALAVASGPMASLAVPSYWLRFDGTDDYITLPSDEGDEPSTEVFIEVWARLVGKESQNQLICRGSFYEQGYSLELTREANTTINLRLSLRNINADATNLGYYWHDNNQPTHLAAGYDGTYIYYFVNGCLMAKLSDPGSITYNGTQWFLGQMPGSIWMADLDMSLIRVSDVCRHTTSFTPPTTYTSDANTVALYMAQEGTGTTLTDSGPGAHHGTFKGTGEPAWSDEADFTNSHGDALWLECLDATAAVTGGSVYLKRVDANTYWLYKKINATGPYWARFKIARSGSATLLNLNQVYTGTPTDAGDAPPDWTVEPATLLQNGTATEYVMQGTMEGGSLIQWGNVHGGEILDTEGWAVDGTPTTLSDGQWASGSEIIYTVTAHVDDGATTFVNITKTLTLNTTDRWLNGDYQLDWLENWTPSTDNYPLMMETESATGVDTFTFIPGGTDYAKNANGTPGICHAVAAWKSTNEAILVYKTSPINGTRFGRCYINGTLEKVYFERTKEVNAALADTTWSWSTQYMPIDGAGNHFLKTT